MGARDGGTLRALGTVLLATVANEMARGEPRDPHAEHLTRAAVAASTGAPALLYERDDHAWLATARGDYLALAAEFNRHSLNARGAAHSEYTPAVADGPAARMHYLSGRLACYFGHAANATRSLRHSLSLEPAQFSVHVTLAKIALGQGKWEEAQEALAGAMALEPRHWQPQLLWAYARRRARAHRDARDEAAERAACAHLDAAAKHGIKGPARGLARVCTERGALPPADDPELGPAADADAAHAAFAQHKYALVRALLPSRLARTVRAWLAHLLRKERREPGSAASFQPKSGRWELHPEPLSTLLNCLLAEWASAATGEDLVPTYPFPIAYERGGSIHPHLDVEDNNISLTYQVAIRPAGAVWPLYFLDPRGADLTALDASDAHALALADNDGVLYRGPQLVHWREPRQLNLTQVVFGFRRVDENSCNNQ